MTYEPGWRWSSDVQPIAGTEWCIYHHLGVSLSGRLRVETPDGTELEIGPRVVARSSAAAASAPFVGRDEELRLAPRLSRCLFAGWAGDGGAQHRIGRSYPGPGVDVEASRQRLNQPSVQGLVAALPAEPNLRDSRVESPTPVAIGRSAASASGAGHRLPGRSASRVYASSRTQQ